MRWRKLGLVHAPDGDRWWARSHAYLPTAEVRDDDCVRVYFSGLDEDSYGRIGYVDLAWDDPTRVVARSADPVLDLGPPGAFDDSGVSPSCIMEHGEARRLYYFGWQRMHRVPYLLFAGLAESGDGGESFVRLQGTPVLDRTPDEQFVRSASTIIRDGRGYRMWYVSATGWTEWDGRAMPEYVVRSARSDDGVTWQADSRPSIELADQDEFGFGRPWVVRDPDVYRMWYSIRSRSRPYRIGYAESLDGESWTRRDDMAGIAASASGWDSEMICFPCVVDVGARRLMFYNGNGHGRTGFGVAELEVE